MPLRNAPSAVPTTLRFMASRLAHRLRGGGATPSTAAFQARVDHAVARLGALVTRFDWAGIGSAPDWVDTGIPIGAGATFTLLADGMVHLSRAFDVGFAPKVGLWFRIGDGPVTKIVGAGATFLCSNGGTLQLASKPPGEFADRHGTFDPSQPRSALSGAFSIAVLQWRDTADGGLEAAAAIDPELFAPVRDRERQPVAPPAGWHYLWRLGDGEIFRTVQEEGHPTLCCHTSADVGILQFPVDHPLTADTRLSWSWRVDQLPSRLPEHVQPTHDYLSIAAEFDNGLDLTWMWSTGLPVGTVFQCPLPWWDQRETHWVVRSGGGELGRWLSERRKLLDDYRVAIGGPEPSRIVAVWLIANTAFQRGVGDCRYRAITLEGGGRTSVVFA